MSTIKVKEPGVYVSMKAKHGTRKTVEAVEKGKELPGMDYKTADAWRLAGKTGYLKEEAAKDRKKLNTSDSLQKVRGVIPKKTPPKK